MSMVVVKRVSCFMPYRGMFLHSNFSDWCQNWLFTRTDATGQTQTVFFRWVKSSEYFTITFASLCHENKASDNAVHNSSMEKNILHQLYQMFNTDFTSSILPTFSSAQVSLQYAHNSNAKFGSTGVLFHFCEFQELGNAYQKKKCIM
jgi:hypothetical protein